MADSRTIVVEDTKKRKDLMGDSLRDDPSEQLVIEDSDDATSRKQHNGVKPRPRT